MKYLLIAIVIFVILFFVKKFLNKFKIVKVGSMLLVTGGVKCGKSTLSVSITLSQYKQRVRKIKFKNFFRKLFRKPLYKLPLVYSNVPLSVPYVPLTNDLLLRKKRFEYGSVIYIQEASLVADSQCIKDMDINERLLMFNKLIGHETLGGTLIYDTQCIGDIHYSIKRCLSNYIYVDACIKWMPFVILLKVREFMYCDDKSTINTVNEDLELTTRTIILSKRTWKKFDAYCFSYLTDSLPVENNVITTKDLKARKIVSFKKYKSVGEEKDVK